MIVAILLPLFGTRQKAWAAKAIDHVPNDAYGFVLLHRLGPANAEAGRLAKLLQAPLPQPLTFLRAVTGIGAGLDPQGDALVALLPGKEGLAEACPMVLLPVLDYPQFVAPLHGDPNGDLCRVKILGEEVLVAKDGDFALFMNVEHEPLMTQLVQIPPEPTAELSELASWMDTQTMVVCLMSHGLESIAALGKSASQAQNEQASPEGLRPRRSPSDAWRMRLASLGVLWDFCDAEIETLALGASLDQQSNLLVSQRTKFADAGNLAEVPLLPQSDKNLLEKWSADPFVVAGATSLAPAHGNLLTETSYQFLRRYPRAYGFEQLTDDDWNGVRESLAAMFLDVDAASFAWLAGTPNDPVYGNLYFRLTVDDADDYLASLERSFELWNRATELSSDPLRCVYELQTSELGERRALIASADIGQATADDNVPLMKTFMEAMFGRDAILRIHVVRLDDRTVLAAISGLEGANKRLAEFDSTGPRLHDRPEVASALALVDQSAACRAVVSLQGFLAWRQRYVDAFRILGVETKSQLVAAPSTSPVALSLHIADGQLHAQIACPSPTLQAVADAVRGTLGAPRR